MCVAVVVLQQGHGDYSTEYRRAMTNHSFNHSSCVCMCVVVVALAKQ